MSAFRNALSRFADADAQVLGASIESMETMKKFADSLTLSFPLLADTDGTLAKGYGVEAGGYADRVTFVIGRDGKVLKVMQGRDAIDPAGALGACPLRKKK